MAKMGAFRFWCQKVLPLVYDDSISYYELLNKMVVYLNNVISDFNAVAENFDNLDDAFDTLQGSFNDTKNAMLHAYDQLQSYVNDYFDNLDVQEEINNKLDEMAEDGSLSRLLEPFIENQISADVAAWLQAHITPTSPAVDSSLTVSGAAADAKVTGDIKRAFLQFTGASDVLNILNYEKGSLTTSTGVNSDFRKNARARTIANTTAPFDFTLEPVNEGSTDFYVRAVFYNADGTFQLEGEEIHAGASLVIRRGQIYRLLIGDKTRQDASSVISLEELLNHIKFSSVFGAEFDGDLRNTFLQFTGASDELNILKYEKGSITTTTGANSDYRKDARARTIVNTTAPFDLTLEPFNEESTDFYVQAVFYNADGAFQSASDLIHEGSSLPISKGQIYRLLIGDTTRQAPTSVISLDELIKHVKIASVFEESFYRDVLHYSLSSQNSTWLTANTDISLLPSGNYVCMNGEVSQTLVGLPISMSKSTFRLMVIQNPAGVKTFILIPQYGNQIFIRKNNYPWFSVGTSNEYAFISAASGSDSNRGIASSPFKTIGFALLNGYRKLKVEPGVYNEKISLENGLLEIIPWVDSQAYSAANAPFRPKIELIKGTKLTISTTGTAGIYQADYTAQAGSNIYKVFVDQSLAPTTAGSLALEYNALLIGDMPNTSTASKPFSPYRQRLYTPVLTETELSAEGTFWYNGTNLVKFHAWNNTADGAYYIPDDDADAGISLAKMDSVRLEDVKVLGCYNNCIYINKCDDVVLTACEAGYCGKGMGIKLDYANAKVSDCHAYAISADGFNLHGYGHSEIICCSAYYCGDDGISHHEGCAGFVDGGEWAYNGSGGITPAFGAQINVKNAYCHHNKRGIQWLGQSSSVRETIMSNCLTIDNSEYDITNEFYVVNGYNCVCRRIYDRYNSARSKLKQYAFTILET